LGTIELGEVAAAEVTPGPELSARGRRALLVALVVIATLFGVAAGRPAQPGLGGPPLWSGTVSLAGFTLGHDSLFSAETNGRVVVARDLRTGRDQWRLDIEALPLQTREVGDGVAAVVTRLPSPEGEHEPLVTLVDARTGHVIGRTAGSMAGPATFGSRLVLQHQRTLDTGDCAVWGEPCLDVFTVDTRTGSEVGRRSFPIGAVTFLSHVDGRIDAYAAMDAAGLVTVYDAGSGATLDTYDLKTTNRPYIVLAPDAMITANRTDDDLTVTAYRRGPLTPLWSTVLRVRGPQDYPTWWFSSEGCGPALCVTVDGRTVVLDRATGRTLFEFDGLPAITVAGELLVGYHEDPRNPTESHSVFVLDLRTGVTVATLDHVDGVPWPDSGGRVLLAQEGKDRTAFLLLDRSGVSRTLGSVPGFGLHCEAMAATLACSDPAGIVRVWPLPL
jgi:hypothetical protein